MHIRANQDSLPRLVSIMVLFLVAACASGRSASDAAPSDSTPVTDADTRSAFGEPCSDNAKCQSGICLDAEADELGWCSTSCKEGCPSGYACRTKDTVCVAASQFLCAACTSDADCGGESNRCIEYAGGRFCASDCANSADVCPGGFSCQEQHADSSLLGILCVSDSALCCIDADGDSRGQGDDCRAADCNDEDPTIYNDAQEVCDGKDNNCDGEVDLHATDCATAACRLSSNGYLMRAAETCTAATCVPQAEVMCGLYTCADGGEQGDECATSCDAEDDSKCTESAHCDDSLCESDLPDGSICDESSDCGSSHCQNGFCCATDDCCQIASDCPSFGSFDPMCEDSHSCQGTVGAAVCTAGNSCATTGEEQNDSACSLSTMASDCGFFLPVFCNGQVDQVAPSCATNCTSSAQCDNNAFCDPTSNLCVEDRVDGGQCSSDNQCQSSHCQNGFCCGTGDCCSSANDCPTSFSTAPSCTVPSACQGQRDLAQCVSSECETLFNASDDSACTSSTVANACGPYPSLVCSGVISQTPPECPTSCTGDTQCDANAYCNSQGQCEFDEGNGSSCAGNSQCVSGHCQNGFCCATGDCCAGNDDCNHLDVAADCDSQSTCQGSRTDGVCQTNSQCTATQISDDSICAGLKSNDCSLYPAIRCTSATTQASNQAALCSASCVSDADCDASAHCQGNSCVPDIGAGGFCDQQSDCSSGLVCVDSVCCDNICAGTCGACDLQGSVGTCSLIPGGMDPDAECDSIDCSTFYFGWEGGTCFAKANVSAALATCGGDGACASQPDECSAQSARGPAALVCDPICQSPNLSSCTGTTPGTCDNLSLGTETCGTGACQVAVNRCSDGSSQSCVANSGAATAEVCDRIDNNCDGNVDNGLPSDDYELNNSCQSHYFLGLLGEGLSQSYHDMTLYTAGDEDWYRQKTTEDFTTCISGVDEEYSYTVTLTPPLGKDYDLEVCYNSFTDSSCTLDCFSNELGGDAPEVIALAWAGPCGGGTNDGLNFFIRVYPFLAANSCEPYSLDTEFLKTN